MIRQYLLAGLFTLLPLMVTLWILKGIFTALVGVFRGPLTWLAQQTHVPDPPAWGLALLSALATLLLLLLVGALVGNFIGRQVLDWLDELMITNTAHGRIGGEVAQRAWSPARLLQHFASRSHLVRLARINLARGHLPTPGVGDETMSPQKQHFGAVHALPVHDDPGGWRRHTYDVMIEPGPPGHLDVGEVQAHPLAVVDRSFAMQGPSHESTA